jgi:hypothetical protein
MKTETAERLTALLFRVSSELDAMVGEIQERESQDEFNRLRSAIARVMGAIHFEILDPTFREHPDVAPDWWKAP